MIEQVHDVVVVGMGPVGLMMTALVGQAGHSAAVVEKHRGLYGLPRAGHVDHEIMLANQPLDAARRETASLHPRRGENEGRSANQGSKEGL